MKNTIKRYLGECDAKPTHLSEASGIPLSTISRYIRGERKPKSDGDHIIRLAFGLHKLILNADPNSTVTEEEVLATLKEAADADAVRAEINTDHLRKLLMELGFSSNKFADEIFYSASGLSRILNGKNSPSDAGHFADIVVNAAADKVGGSALIGFVRDLTGIKPDENDSAKDILRDWLLGKYDKDEELLASKLLSSIDEFDYETYLAGVDTKKVDAIPTFRYKLPITKKYKGKDGLEKGISDFMRATATSIFKDPIFLYSDHPLSDMTEKQEVINAWVKAIGASIIQGKKIQILHNVDRPAEELLAGLENWLPLYMTGAISSFYFDSGRDILFNHIHLVSGAASLVGQAAGDIGESSYTFSKALPKIREARKTAESLLARSRQLVDVYNQDRVDEYTELLTEASHVIGNRYAYSDQLPIHTLTESLLEKILAHNEIEEDAALSIQNIVATEKKRISTILSHSHMRELVYVQEQKSDYNAEGRFPELAFRNAGNVIILGCGRDEYEEHLSLTREYAEAHKNYSFFTTDELKFKRIRIEIREGSHALITRNAGREIHFVIRYPKLIDLMLDTIF